MYANKLRAARNAVKARRTQVLHPLRRAEAFDEVAAGAADVLLGDAGRGGAVVAAEGFDQRPVLLDDRLPAPRGAVPLLEAPRLSRRDRSFTNWRRREDPRGAGPSRAGERVRCKKLRPCESAKD